MPETPDGGWILDDRDTAGPYGRAAELAKPPKSTKPEKKDGSKPWPNVKRRD